MPLIKGKSKKALKENIETEMKAHPGEAHRAQNLAIAFDVQRKNKPKKMAAGGAVSASSEKRPMPDDKHNDRAMASRNSGDKAPKSDNWEDKPTVMEAQKPSPAKKSRPPLVGSDAFSVRYSDEVEEESRPISSIPPESDKAKPNSRYADKSQDRSGTAPHPMKMMADGGEVDDEFSVETEKPSRSPAEIMDSMAMHQKAVEDHKKELEESQYGVDHYADGGNVSLEQSKEEPKDSEYSMERTEKPSSIAEAVMSRRKSNDPGESDLDNMEGNSEELEPLNEAAADHDLYDDSQLSDQPEDSNEHGDASLVKDTHDMVESIRKRMKSKRGA